MTRVFAAFLSLLASIVSRVFLEAVNVEVAIATEMVTVADVVLGCVGVADATTVSDVVEAGVGEGGGGSAAVFAPLNDVFSGEFDEFSGSGLLIVKAAVSSREL